MSILFSTIMNKINEIRPQASDYLKCLSDIDNPVERLYYSGKLPAERRTTVAIVGSRKPTAYGREVTAALASALASKGIVIISGLAYGIDAIAHQAALDAHGTTLAVQANGLHRIYPSANHKLGENIVASGGAIISEYEPGVEPMQHRFLERNRIVSGLADAIIVTEAAARSGTLNTASHAINQGHEVFAVPGNITSAMSAGCNLLIRQGAQPLTSIDDIFDFLNISENAAQTILPIGGTPLEQAIIDAIASGLRDGEQILARAKTTVSDFNVALTTLEISGIIRPLGANKWQLR